MAAQLDEFNTMAEDIAGASRALATRFSSGATMWCVAPGRHEHAHHVAVEFVHPVIVGKRALPAVSVDAADPVVVLRGAVRPGDVAVLIGPSTDALAELAARCRTWGVAAVWIGTSRRPLPGLCDHLLWLDDSSSTAAYSDGRVVLVYHLLWELTHLCIEHGVVVDALDEHDRCVTCGDLASVAEVRKVDGDGLARVVVAGEEATIDATLLGGVRFGDLVLVHAGVAIGPFDPGGTQ